MFADLSLTMVLVAVTCAAQKKPTEVASLFLPPGTRIAELERFDPKTGKPTESLPAVIILELELGCSRSSSLP